jgi:MOSC domain-containing protein YiiM
MTDHPALTIVSVNVGPTRSVEHNGKTVRTAIYKSPVAGPVRVTSLGLEGDQQADKEHHGGEHMAVYAYTAANYDFWRAELGSPTLAHSTFGENLTIEGLDEADVCIGDRFRVGPDVELEVSVPRAPCSKLAMVMDDPGFPKRFLATGRVGFYLRVVREGKVSRGDRVERTRLDPARLAVAEVARTMYFDKANRAAVARAAGVAALAPKWRERFAEILAGADA